MTLLEDTSYQHKMVNFFNLDFIIFKLEQLLHFTVKLEAFDRVNILIPKNIVFMEDFIKENFNSMHLTD